jgi:hypothetical protein
MVGSFVNAGLGRERPRHRHLRAPCAFHWDECEASDDP